MSLTLTLYARILRKRWLHCVVLSVINGVVLTLLVLALCKSYPTLQGNTDASLGRLSRLVVRQGESQLRREFSASEATTLTAALRQQGKRAWGSVIAAIRCQQPDEEQAQTWWTEFVQGEQLAAGTLIVYGGPGDASQTRCGGVPVQIERRKGRYEGPDAWRKVSAVMSIEDLPRVKPDVKAMWDKQVPLLSIYCRDCDAQLVQSALGGNYHAESVLSAAVRGGQFTQYLWTVVSGLLAILFLTTNLGILIFLGQVGTSAERSLRIATSLGGSPALQWGFSVFGASALVGLTVVTYCVCLWCKQGPGTGLLSMFGALVDFAPSMSTSFGAVCILSSIYMLILAVQKGGSGWRIANRAMAFEIAETRQVLSLGVCGGLFVFVTLATTLSVQAMSEEAGSDAKAKAPLRVVEFHMTADSGTMAAYWLGQRAAAGRGVVSIIPGSDRSKSETVASLNGRMQQLGATEVSKEAFQFLKIGKLEGLFPEVLQNNDGVVLTRAAADTLLSAGTRIGEWIRYRNRRYQVAGIVDGFGLGPAGNTPQLILPFGATYERSYMLLTQERKSLRSWQDECESFGVSPVQLTSLQTLTESVRKPFFLVFAVGVVSLVLTLGCLFAVWFAIATEFMTRRRKEIAIRMCLGAGRWDLIRLFAEKFGAVILTSTIAGFLFVSFGTALTGDWWSRPQMITAFALTAVVYWTAIAFAVLPPLVRGARRHGWYSEIQQGES